MKHFSSRLVSSFTLKLRPSQAMERAVALEFIRTLDPVGIELEQSYSVHVRSFVFDGDRTAANWLYRHLTSAEFRSVVDFRVWFKELDKQFNNRSPRYWTRTSDFIYVNLNSGKSFVCIDGHYWD